MSWLAHCVTSTCIWGFVMLRIRIQTHVYSVESDTGSIKTQNI